MTVSRVLRHDAAISEKTSGRVREIADRLGYRPNPLISAFTASLRATHQVKNPPYIAFFTTAGSAQGWRKEFFSRSIFEGAEARAAQLGYGLSPVWVKEPGMTEKRLEGILDARGVQGVIVGTLTPLSRLRLDWSRFAVAASGYTLIRPAFHRVASNHAQTMNMVLEMLRTRGYRRIGLAMTQRTDLLTDHLILGAYQAWQFLQPKQDQVETCYLKKEDETEFNRWIRDRRPEVVLVTEVVMHEWLLKSGLGIPGDVGVVVLATDRVPKGLAHIRRDYGSIGAALVDLVVEQLHRNERGVPPVPRLVSISTTWEEGASIMPGVAGRSKLSDPTSASD